MAIIEGNKDGEVGGFEKFPIGESAAVFKELRYHIKDNETKIFQMWLTWNSMESEYINISQYVDFTKPKSFTDFVTALIKCGVAAKIKAKYPEVFPSGYGVDDDKVFEKANGVPTKIKEGFLAMIRNELNGATVGIEAVDNKGFVNIKKYFDLKERKPNTQAHGNVTQAVSTPTPKKEYNF
jgi:hypothetical protein